MKKDLSEFSFDTLWLFFREKLINILIIILILYLPAVYFVYKNSPENWNVNVTLVEKTENISAFIYDESNFKSRLHVDLVLTDFFEMYSKFLAQELNTDLDRKLEYQLGSDEVRLKLNAEFFGEVFSKKNRYWVKDYWQTRGIKISRDKFLTEYESVIRDLMFSVENTLSAYSVEYNIIDRISVVPGRVKGVMINLSTKDFKKNEIRDHIISINEDFQYNYNKILFRNYGLNDEKTQNLDLMEFELNKIEKFSKKLINSIKLFFVISLTVYVVYFIFFYRKSIRL